MESDHKLEGFGLAECYQTTSLSLSLRSDSTLAHSLPRRPESKDVDITEPEKILILGLFVLVYRSFAS